MNVLLRRALHGTVGADNTATDTTLRNRALEIVRAHVAKANNASNATTPVRPRRAMVRYAELAEYIAIGDIKGVVDVFGDVRGDIDAANALAEYCVARWDMTPEVFECIKHHLKAPLAYPIVYDMPDGDYVDANDFANIWRFKRYCQLIEMMIKTRPGFVHMAPLVDAPLKLSGINATVYGLRHKHAKFATPIVRPTFVEPTKPTTAEIFAYISYQFHEHNLEVVKTFAVYKISAESIAHLENHFEFCTRGEACNIHKLVGVITNANPEFVVPVAFKATFETITGIISAPKNALRTITNMRNGNRRDGGNGNLNSNLNSNRRGSKCKQNANQQANVNYTANADEA